MKKILLLSIFTLVLCVAMFAQGAIGRVISQWLILEEGNILDVITNTGTTHSPHYVLRGLHVESGIERGTDLGDPINAFRITTGGGRALSSINQSRWSSPWPEGTTVMIRIWYLGTAAGYPITSPSGVEPYPNAEYAEKYVIIPAGTNAITLMNPGQEMIVPPFPAGGPTEYTINVTSNPSGQPIWLDGVNTGFVTPHVFTFKEGWDGLFTVVNPAYTWSPPSYQVTDLTDNNVVHFEGTLSNPVFPATNPSPENNAQIPITGPSSITLSWSPPSKGTPPTGYKVIFNNQAPINLGLQT
ncbi:MAG: hypothetical protein U1C33_06725, partial [Candidatus Cloacimonadaceae bacterium]|nr:hypothetical protein [Candidatus Cloacimonadaceae bacterium]